MIELRLTHIEHRLDDLEHRLAEIERHARASRSNTDWLVRAVAHLVNMEVAEMSDLSLISSKVSEAVTVEEGAAVLLAELGDLLRANANDPAAIQALAEQLDASHADLQSAIVANTPAAPVEPEPSPEPDPSPEPAPVDDGSTPPTDGSETPAV